MHFFESVVRALDGRDENLTIILVRQIVLHSSVQIDPFVRPNAGLCSMIDEAARCPWRLSRLRPDRVSRMGQQRWIPHVPGSSAMPSILTVTGDNPGRPSRAKAQSRCAPARCAGARAERLVAS